jgi:hypothetical protein
VDQVAQRRLHRLHLGDPCLQRRDLRLGQMLHIGTRPRPVLPKRQKIGNLLHRKAKVPRPADEAQRLHIARAIGAVARPRAPGGGDETRFLVIADHLGRHARGAGGFTDVHDAAP